jgi:hypothetical protein
MNPAVFTAMTKSSTAMGYIVNNQATLSYLTDIPILNNLLYDGVVKYDPEAAKVARQAKLAQEDQAV